ncbi:MAG: hypothetical protein PHV51_07355 [Methanosarcinaceae archaeon]|nr:hypothetical protein [Methanosarcinaceae archaeon]MDD4497948.1 hypothetical protein [Methanosarcinaceae archaeon]
MSSDENNISINEFGATIAQFLEPDTPEILELKSLFNLEYEYSEYLGTIEYTIANYYYDINRKLLDKEVISALKNIKQNYDKDIAFFKNDLENVIVEDLLEILEDSPLTHHEFKLVLDYVLWVIDNRSWVEDDQAYLKWTAYALNLFSKEEKEKYEKEFKMFASEMGLTDAQVDMLLMKKEPDELFEEGGLFEGLEESDVFDKDTVANDLETGFFLMNDDEKFDFLLEQGPDYIELVQSYVADLAEKGDLEKLQAFYKKLGEKEKDFFPLHLIMGIVYLRIDPALANTYFEETLRIASKSEQITEDLLEELKQMINTLNKAIQNASPGDL